MPTNQFSLVVSQRATVAETRRQNWVTQAMKKASACIEKCVTCFRYNSGPAQQLMVDLPSERIEAPERAFSCVGLFSTGPLPNKNGTECVKGYVAVFICFASKTVHLKGVSSLTSDAMMAALRRFIARRGIASQVVSDNAANFVGESGPGRSTIIQQHWMALHSSELTQLWRNIGSSCEVDESQLVKSQGHPRSHLQGDDNNSMPNSMTIVLSWLSQTTQMTFLRSHRQDYSVEANLMLSHSPVRRRWMPVSIQ